MIKLENCNLDCDDLEFIRHRLLECSMSDKSLIKLSDKIINDLSNSDCYDDNDLYYILKEECKLIKVNLHDIFSDEELELLNEFVNKDYILSNTFEHYDL